MARARRGNLRIVAVRDQDARNAATELLAAAEEIPEPEAEKRLGHLPLLLREDIAQPEATEIAEYLQQMGVETQFALSDKTQHKAKARKHTQAARLSPRRHLMLPLLLFLFALALMGWILWPK